MRGAMLMLMLLSMLMVGCSHAQVESDNTNVTPAPVSTNEAFIDSDVFIITASVSAAVAIIAVVVFVIVSVRSGRINCCGTSSYNVTQKVTKKEDVCEENLETGLEWDLFDVPATETPEGGEYLNGNALLFGKGYAPKPAIVAASSSHVVLKSPSQPKTNSEVEVIRKESTLRVFVTLEKGTELEEEHHDGEQGEGNEGEGNEGEGNEGEGNEGEGYEEGYEEGYGEGYEEGYEGYEGEGYEGEGYGEGYEEGYGEEGYEEGYEGYGEGYEGEGYEGEGYEEGYGEEVYEGYEGEGYEGEGYEGQEEEYNEEYTPEEQQQKVQEEITEIEDQGMVPADKQSRPERKLSLDLYQEEVPQYVPLAHASAARGSPEEKVYAPLVQRESETIPEPVIEHPPPISRTLTADNLTEKLKDDLPPQNFADWHNNLVSKVSSWASSVILTQSEAESPVEEEI